MIVFFFFQTQEARRKYLDEEKRNCKQMFGFKDLNDTETADKEDEAVSLFYVINLSIQRRAKPMFYGKVECLQVLIILESRF